MKTYHNVWVSNVSACMGGGLANEMEMESHTSSARVQAVVGHVMRAGVPGSSRVSDSTKPSDPCILKDT